LTNQKTEKKKKQRKKESEKKKQLLYLAFKDKQGYVMSLFVYSVMVNEKVIRKNDTLLIYSPSHGGTR